MVVKSAHAGLILPTSPRHEHYRYELPITDTASLLNVAGDLLKTGRLQEAKPVLDGLVGLYPTNAEIPFLAAVNDLALGELLDGGRHLCKAIAINPALPDAGRIRQEALQLLHAAAVRKHQAYELSEARDLYRVLLSLDPEHGPVSRNLEILEASSRPEEIYTIGITRFDVFLKIFVRLIN